MQTLCPHVPTLLGVLLAAMNLVSGPVGAVADHAVILMYHHVSATAPVSTSVSPELFEAHLDYLAENGFRVRSLPEVVESLTSGASLPDSVVVLTFDDGYRSVYEEAFPRLKERGWPFTVFVCTEAIDGGQGPVCSWDQLREMAGQGATIASHGLVHRHLQRLLPGENRITWARRTRTELETSQQRILAETGQKYDLLAFPYGESDVFLQALVQDLGWVAFGQQSGAAGRLNDLTCLPRFPMAAGFASLESFPSKVSSLPLPVVGVQAEELELFFGPDSVMLGAQPPRLRLVLDPGAYRGNELAAYAGGQGRITSNWDPLNRILDVRGLKPMSPGRHRYNITAPDPTGQRWYWYSHTWVVGQEHQD